MNSLSLFRYTPQSLRFEDLQVVSEFRAKLKMTEDLIEKLSFSLGELRALPGLHNDGECETFTESTSPGTSRTERGVVIVQKFR